MVSVTKRGSVEIRRAGGPARRLEDAAVRVTNSAPQGAFAGCHGQAKRGHADPVSRNMPASSAWAWHPAPGMLRWLQTPPAGARRTLSPEPRACARGYCQSPCGLDCTRLGRIGGAAGSPRMATPSRDAHPVTSRCRVYSCGHALSGTLDHRDCKSAAAELGRWPVSRQPDRAILYGNRVSPLSDAQP